MPIPASPLLRGLTLLALASPAVAQPQPQAYLIDSNLDQLFTVDLTTGAATLVASTNNNGLTTPADLAWRADTRELWTIDLSGGEVGTIDTTAGTFTKRFDTNLGGWQGMAWDPAAQRFFASNQNNNNYVLDPVAGTTTLLGATGLGYFSSMALDHTGALWGIVFANGAIATIDKNTGAATRVTTTIGGFGAMSFDASGRLLGANSNDDSLHAIDPMTGSNTSIGAHGAGVQFAKGFTVVADACFAGASGQGCRDSQGTPVAMQAQGTPCVGRTFSVAAKTGLPAWLLALGTVRDRMGTVPLPFDLAPLGAPGCRVYTNPVLILGAATAAPVMLVVPNDPTLRGLHLYLQAFVPDSAANPLGLATSDLLTVVVGS